jgi:ABC-type transport system involved in cytochrome c biogenesis permease subunit
MLSGISVFCFAASYAVALALEATRLWFKSGVRGALMLGFAAAGLVAHTLFLAYRAITADEAPLSSAFDWYLLAAWVVVAIYLCSIYYYPRASIGIFVLPLVLALIGMAQLSDREPFPQDPAAQFWGVVHGALLLLGYVAVIVGFVAGLMYLLQAHWLKHKQHARRLRLPSLEWLDRVNGHAIVLSAIFVGAGFIAGVILNVVNHRQQLDYVPWTDPIVWRAGGMMAWLVVAAVFSRLYRPANHGRKVAYLTVASFVFLAITMVMRPIVDSEHRAKEEIQTRRQGDRETRRETEQRFQANLLVSLSPPLLVLNGDGSATSSDVASTSEVAS